MSRDPAKQGEVDRSGTPWALLETLKRNGRLVVLERLDEDQVLIEFPFAEPWRSESGCQRFVRLRRPVDGAAFALIRESVGG
jgi:hypothetical protein